MKPTIQLFKADSFSADEAGTLTLPNDADPREASLEGIHTVQLEFPSFADGRAFSQAFLLRRRLGFTGQIRAIGDVLIDQLAQMQRSGFTQAVLRADQSIEHGQKLLVQYDAYYQGDAVDTRPHFAHA
ncbi:DUF934 domain-containing protein [Hydrogenophaga luteola]|uniref:DUF934 domain-containing protein n=1 Tax=Hydrogenophaga luteola TaxID=1591122 RepID=A0ABV7W873_9BURK